MMDINIYMMDIYMMYIYMMCILYIYMYVKYIFHMYQVIAANQNIDLSIRSVSLVIELPSIRKSGKSKEQR